MLPRLRSLLPLWLMLTMPGIAAQPDSIARQPHHAATPREGLAIRTNLLRWATFTPEVGVMWHIAPTWDLQLDAAWSSASWQYRSRRYALWYVSPEVRRRVGRSRRLYAGLRLEAGKRHYKVSETGHVGWVWGAGLTAGYEWRISRRTAVDFGLGAGADVGLLKAYDLDPYFDGQDPVRTYRGTERHHYYGINHLGISLVWEL